ncbi:MAG: hypothetical protein P8X77_17560 [Maritimibacter sp.]
MMVVTRWISIPAATLRRSIISPAVSRDHTNLCGSGSDIRFGAGSFHIGKGACGYSICDYGTIIFEGLGDYVFDAGIKVGQGATLKLGDGAYANYYYMGAGQNGNAINVEQSGRLEFGDAIGQIDGFRVDGKFANGGGACTVFPKTDNHDFSDNVYMRGAAIFGAGAYHVDVASISQQAVQNVRRMLPRSGAMT